AKVRPQDPEKVDAAFEALAQALHASDEFAIVAQMKALVPEFKSNNSRFVVLDKPAPQEAPVQNETKKENEYE
ncbi:MAG: hypothetical protein J6X35_00660, partial [Bacteroidales bacterium]|nr:hypothetical protein [Bacteroidales bacterium]